ncbi:MAG: hypothetical protein ACR2IL_07695 [Chitinophagaceae bacterium]
MRYYLFLLVFLLGVTTSSKAVPWRSSQLDSANTEKNNSLLSAQEKEAILYINLCRLYPQQFIQNEVTPYKLPPGYSDPELNQYKSTLIATLKNRKPISALRFDRELFNDVVCYSAEIAVNDIPPHQRIKCPKFRCAECIAYGFEDGRNIALQLLIDSGVPSLGHRKICLDAKYTKVGIKNATHFEYRFCSVLNFC